MNDAEKFARFKQPIKDQLALANQPIVPAMSETDKAAQLAAKRIFTFLSEDIERIDDRKKG